MGQSAVVQYWCRFRPCALPRMSRRVKIRGFSFSELTVSRDQAAVSRICGRGGIGRLGGFRCCHLSEGFSFCRPHRKIKYAGMMELADMQDLGSCAAMRWGSNPHARTTILRQSIFVDCRIFFCFSEHLSILKNPSHHERVTSAVSYASTNSAVLLLSDWLPPSVSLNTGQ